MLNIIIALSLIISTFANDDIPTNTFGEETDNPAVLEYDKLKFDSEIQSSPHFVEFYAPWCGHCKQLEPIWEMLGLEFNVEGRQETVTIAKVDCTVHTELCSEQGIQGYPTLKFYKGDTSEKYQGGRDIDALSSFIHDSAGSVKSENGLHTLTDENFNDHIAQGNHFIKFYAPWCGHCQTLAPTWRSLANTVQANKELPVSIAHIDCTSSPVACKQQEIKGYPTLMYFSNGLMVEKYQGSRTEDKFVDFLEKVLGQEAINQNTDVKEPVQVEEEPQIDDAASTVSRDGNVLIGSEDNFGEIIANHYSFVKFYAPWCGHCKGMAKEWKLLADHYSRNYEIKIAEVDCTQHSLVCKKYEIDGYPTLILFDSGNKKLEYEYDREFDSFVDFIKKETPINHDEL